MKTMIQEILTLVDELGVFELKPHAKFYRTISECKTASFYATLNNLMDSGLLRKQTREESTTFQLTGKGRSRLKPVKAFPIKRRRRWDGKFRLFMFNIPEERRRDRDLLRTHLKEVGFGMLHPSVWILSHEMPPETFHWLDVRRYDRYVLYFVADRFRYAGASDIFKKAWNLEGVREKYCEFMEEKHNRIRRFFQILRSADSLPVQEITRWMIRDLDESYASVFRSDPFLPKEFLPLPWPGNKARALYRRLRRKLQKQIAEQ